MQSPPSLQFSHKQSRESEPTPKFPHRKYHKISQFSPDEQFVVNYLKQRGYSRAVKCLQQQINQNKPKQLVQANHFQITQSKKDKIIEMFDRGPDKIDFQVLLKEFDEVMQTQGGDLQTKLPHLKVKFYLHVWSITKTIPVTLKEERRGEFKCFIEKYGDQLAQDDQLLPYFALVYIEDPRIHPFLSKTYTLQWEQTLRQLMTNLMNFPNQEIGRGEEQTNPDQRERQWYLFFSDLVQISSKICKQLPTIKKMDKSIAKMIQKVQQYQKVLKEYQVHLSSQNNSQSINDSADIENARVYGGHSNSDRSQLTQTSKFIRQLEGVLKIKPKFTQKTQNKINKSKYQVEAIDPQSLDLSTLKLELFSLIRNPNRTQGQKQKAIQIMDYLRKLFNIIDSIVRKELIYLLVDSDIFSIKKQQYRAYQPVKDSGIKSSQPSKQLIIMGLGTDDGELLKSFLTFLNKIASFYIGRSYILDNSINTLMPICNGMLKAIVFDNLPINHTEQDQNQFYHYNNNSDRKVCNSQRLPSDTRKVLNLLLSFLYKLSAREEVADYLIRSGAMRTIDVILSNFEILEKQTITFALAILELMISQKSTQESLASKIFENVTKILSAFARQISSEQFPIYQELESHLHATLYLFLESKQYQQKAENINLKDVLVTNMLIRNDECYTKQVQHIIRRIDYGLSSAQGIKQIEIGKDHEQSSQGSEQQIQLSQRAYEQPDQYQNSLYSRQCMEFLNLYQKKSINPQNVKNKLKVYDEKGIKQNSLLVALDKDQNVQSQNDIKRQLIILQQFKQKGDHQQSNYIRKSKLNLKSYYLSAQKQKLEPNKRQLASDYLRDNYQWRRMKK